MQISYHGGEFFCDAHEKARVLKDNKWLWDGEYWVTSDVKNVDPLYSFCTPAARKKVDKWRDGFLERIKDSFASTSNLNVPAPPGLSYLGYQVAGVEYCLSRKDVLIADPMGLGKQAALDTKLLTPTGWVEMGSAYVGMPIIAEDGNTYNVTGVYPQGRKPSYRVTFRDGTSTKCGEEHLWAYMSKNHVKRKQGWQVAPLSKLMKMGIHTVKGHNKFQIPLMKAAKFEEKSFLIHPYTLGALLGDGSLSRAYSVCLTSWTNDKENRERVLKTLPEGMSITESQYENTVRSCIVDKGRVENRVAREIVRLNLNNVGKYKFIPKDYMFASVEQRLDLLRGLMDTDGSANSNRITYHSCNEQLANDVASLVRSLGGVAIVRKYERSDGKTDEYQVNVKLQEFCPFYLKRKASNWSPAVRNKPSKFIEKVEYVGEEEQQCISVSSPSKLYVTDDYIVTHNTVQAIGYSNIDFEATQGRAQPYDSLVLTPNGFQQMGSLKVGDCISNPYGGVQWVSAIYEKGERTTYRLTFDDGSQAECCDEHLWNVEIDAVDKTLELKEIIRYLDEGHFITIPMVSSPLYNESPNLQVDPYLLGVIWAGSGRVNQSGSVDFVCQNDSQRDLIIHALDCMTEMKHGFNYRETTTGVHVNTSVAKKLSEVIKNTNLLSRNTESFDAYSKYFEKLNTVERVFMIQGYLDHVAQSAQGFTVLAHPVSPLATHLIRRLVMSIGGKAILLENGSMTIHIPQKFDPFLTDEGDAYHNINSPLFDNEIRRLLVAVERLELKKMRCIRVSGKDRLYVTNDYIVTHNSNVKNILIIVPATLKENWKREFEKWDVFGRTVGLTESKSKSRTIKNADGTKKVERWTEHIWPNTHVVIVNYEALDTFDIQIKAKYWDLVILDECDRLRNLNTKQAKCVFGGVHKKKVGEKTVKKKYSEIKSKKTIWLTGTPIPKSPINMWPIIQKCDPRGLGASWKKFVYRYCDAQEGGFGLDTSGASNLEELQYKMRKSFMIRRNKEEVLSELPPKRREIILLPKQGLSKQIERELSIARRGIYEFEKMMGIAPSEEEELNDAQLAEFMLAWGNRHTNQTEIIDKIKNTPLDIAFEEFAEARNELAMAKIPMIQERIDAALEEHECLIFFGVHTQFIEALRKKYIDCSAMITGKVPVKKRQEQVDIFQNDKDCRIFFGNITAAGVGITLTRAHLTMFGELEWNPTAILQAEDRMWRIGQTNACLVQQMIAEGSLDARFVQVLLEKQEIADRALEIDRLSYQAVHNPAQFG